MLGRRRQRDPRYPGPTLQDWALVAIGVGFVAVGLLILPRDPAMAAGGIVFFGACAVVAALNIVRKLRFARLRPLSVEIIGGVPLRPSRRHAALLGASVLAVGLALGVAVLQASFAGRTAMLVCVVVMIAAGGYVLGGVLLGKLPVGFLQFDEEGLSVGQRGLTLTIGWDNVAHAWPGEFHDNAVLLLSVRDLDALVVRPAGAKEQAIKRLRSSEEWLGAHVMVMTETYGIDLPLLVLAVERYVSDPASRAGLALRRLPGAP